MPLQRSDYILKVLWKSMPCWKLPMNECSSERKQVLDLQLQHLSESILSHPPRNNKIKENLVYASSLLAQEWLLL